MLHDYGKAINIGIIAVAMFVLMLVGKVDQAVGVPVLVGLAGYLTGNGVNAVRKNAPSPVLVAKSPSTAGVLVATAETVAHAVDDVVAAVDHTAGAKAKTKKAAHKAAAKAKK